MLRKLTGSELGWFSAPRELGKAKGRQRGINFNAAEIAEMFPEEVLATGEIAVNSRRFSDGKMQKRRILRQEKNWRLVGDKVSGVGLELLEEGDFFWAEINTEGKPPFPLTWDVVCRRGGRELHERVGREFEAFLSSRMACWPISDSVADYLGEMVGLHRIGVVAEPAPPSVAPALQSVGTEPSYARQSVKPLPPPPKPSPKRQRIGSRLQTPHILTQILKSGMALSASAQADFIDVLDTISAELRGLMLDAGLIQKVEIDHTGAWAKVKGCRIGFVDGGMSNVALVGAAPVAIRVGSYIVTPGEKGPEREEFGFEIQLVDDLYEASSNREGIFEDLFEDIAKLRDVARISCEVGGLLSLAQKVKAPKVALLHGPLVNPVSPYALGRPGELGAFPNFTDRTIQLLLPGKRESRTGAEANFVSVYLEQLKRLATGKATVAGIVERPSSATPGPLIRTVIESMQERGQIDAKTRREFVTKLEGYRITDSVICECVLEEGEYVTPIDMDKQGPDHKIPVVWMQDIKSYPKPLTTYVKPSRETMPIRVESFRCGPLLHPQLMTLIVHMSRLLPHYSFPVGLDIVDKHAKVPEWMSKQVNVMLQAQLMRKAMETGNPNTIRMARRILSANTRDWLFRPDFKKG
jgi:hypothetical protein